MVKVRALFSRTIRCMLEYIRSWVFCSRTIICIFEYFRSWVLHPLQKFLDFSRLPDNDYGILGDIIYKDMRLGEEMINSWNLPVKIKYGIIGTMKVQVPRRRQESSIVLIDRLVLVAEPAPDGHTFKVEDFEKLYERKLKTMDLKKHPYLGHVFKGIIGNLQVTFTNSHIRYEDSKSDASLAAFVDAS